MNLYILIQAVDILSILIANWMVYEKFTKVSDNVQVATYEVSVKDCLKKKYYAWLNKQESIMIWFTVIM